MKISIVARYRPFSHKMGSKCLLPRTVWLVEAFPALIRLRSLEMAGSEETIEIPLNVKGPVSEFTLEQDLERGSVLIWGNSIHGRYRLRLEAMSSSIKLVLEKGIELRSGPNLLKKGEPLYFPLSGPVREGLPIERLSFGRHRSQDLDLMMKRFDLRDLLPLLYQLSQWIPRISQQGPFGMAALLEEGFELFFRGAFSDLLCPRVMDDQHQGLLVDQTISPHASPCSLIAIAGDWIRNSLVGVQERVVLLKSLSKGFDCARFIGVQLEGIGTIDIEWSKGALRRAVLRVSQSGAIRFDFDSLQTCRIRSSLNEKGRRIASQEACEFESNQTYFLDRFQK